MAVALAGLALGALGSLASASSKKKNPEIENRPISVPVQSFLNKQAGGLGLDMQRDQDAYDKAKSSLESAYGNTQGQFDNTVNLWEGFKPNGETSLRLQRALDDYEGSRKEASRTATSDAIKRLMARASVTGAPGNGANTMTLRTLAKAEQDMNSQIAMDVAARRLGLEGTLLDRELAAYGELNNLYTQRASDQLKPTNLQQQLEDYYINRAGQISQGISGNTQTIVTPPKPSTGERLGAVLPQLGSLLVQASPYLSGSAPVTTSQSAAPANPSQEVSYSVSPITNQVSNGSNVRNWWGRWNPGSYNGPWGEWSNNGGW